MSTLNIEDLIAGDSTYSIGDVSIPLIKGEKGDKGDKGNKGDKGDKGDTGPAGTTNYSELTNKPTVNGVSLSGTLTSSDLSLQGALTAGSNITISSNTISATDTTYSNATTSVAGLMSASDKTKLDGVASGAQVNVLESVSVNGTPQTITSKGVNITIPTKVSDITNDTGFITATDYATSSEGGVIKIGNLFDVDSSGIVKCTTLTASQYIGASNSAFISRGTLANVLEDTIGDINSALDTINRRRNIRR